MVLKGDSCMLNGRKPLFVPEWTDEPVMSPCLVLRVSRLGKEIDVRFADRYYDAIAPGVDFAAADALRDAQAKRQSWTKAIAFDYSLALGEWCDKSSRFVWEGCPQAEWLLTPEQAISEASRVMTVRQGDLIYIQSQQPPQGIRREQILRATLDGIEKLYCKIK